MAMPAQGSRQGEMPPLQERGYVVHRQRLFSDAGSQKSKKTHVKTDRTAAGKRRSMLARAMPAEMATRPPIKQAERSIGELARSTVVGCKPSAMPQANAATIATAGSLMVTFAT